MLCLDLETTDPFFNLAVDEYLLKNKTEDFFVLGINDRSVVTGKHQVAHREADARYVTENNIPVIRRISGGGTVFHDKGNLNFSFIMMSEYGKQVDFRKYTLPVISFLSSLGADAKFEGKNDLKINGLKISGNAEHVYHNRILHHGTLLFDTDLVTMKNSISKDSLRYESRAVQSNPSSVTNIKVVLKDHFPEITDIVDFRSSMLCWFLRNYPESQDYCLSDDEKNEIRNIADSKYRSWEWNYAYGPEYYFNNSFEFGGEKCNCRFFVKEGIIRECEIKGPAKLVSASEKLTGSRHMVNDLQDILKEEGIFAEGFDVYNLF
jgi:lipoate-protein ligase A